MKMRNYKCRFCGNVLEFIFADLGLSPVSNANLRKEELGRREQRYPLTVYVCEKCFLVQLPEHQTRENIFHENYPYFSSFSPSLLEHSRDYADMAEKRFGLNSEKLVVEIASNDGYLLQYFKPKGMQILGVEPSSNVAAVAKERGIPTIVKFFGGKTAEELVQAGKRADLLIGNNVFAHVPDINDFTAGLKILLKPDGVLTLQFHYLGKLIEGRQFDHIYHEHFSYFSLMSAENILSHHGLEVFDVEELETEGGSLRLYIKHEENGAIQIMDSVKKMRATEQAKGFDNIEIYGNFMLGVEEIKKQFMKFTANAAKNDKTIAGYGAPAKGTIFLNYCGVEKKIIRYTVDDNPNKQGLFLPGVHIPILHPDALKKAKPDYLLILPWNIRDSIVEKSQYIREWGGKFVVAMPSLEIF